MLKTLMFLSCLHLLLFLKHDWWTPEPPAVSSPLLPAPLGSGHSLKEDHSGLPLIGSYFIHQTRVAEFIFLLPRIIHSAA